ncbi:hypothetical protein ACFQ4K_26390 [Tistrella bauzanensis]
MTETTFRPDAGRHPGHPRRAILMTGVTAAALMLGACTGSANRIESARRAGWAMQQDLTVFLAGGPPIVIETGPAAPGGQLSDDMLADAVRRAIGRPLPRAMAPTPEQARPGGAYVLLSDQPMARWSAACDRRIATDPRPEPVVGSDSARPAGGTIRLQLAFCTGTGETLAAATVAAGNPWRWIRPWARR